MFGIDRVKFKGVGIEYIDINKLQKRGGTIIQDDPIHYRILTDSSTGQKVGINYVKISKKQDQTLKLNEIKIGRGVIPALNIMPWTDYEHLDANLPSQISCKGINDNNIKKTTDLIAALDLLQEELQELGFGTVDLLKATIDEIELNTNIPISKTFEAYKEPLLYLFSLLPKTLKSQRVHKQKGRFTGVVVKNTQQEIKFYDKKQQIKDKTGINIERIIRLEYTLKTAAKIKSTLGVETLEDIITDNFQQLQTTMTAKLYKDFIARAYKDIAKQVRHATRHLKAYKGKGGATAGQHYIYDYSVFDLEIMLQGLKNIDKSNNFNRDAQKEIERAIQGKNKDLIGNLNKLNEILDYLGYEKIELDLTEKVRKELQNYY